MNVSSGNLPQISAADTTSAENTTVKSSSGLKPAEEKIEDVIRRFMLDNWRREILLSEGGWSEEKKLEW